MATQTTTHQADALARLPERHNNKTKLAALINACTNETQNIENALWQLASERSIGVAVGEQLDVIGRIVGQDRATSASDAEYRLLLRARMTANQSSGSVNDIVAVFAAILESYEDIELTQYFPAALILSIIGEEPITDAEGTLFADFLSDSKAAGIGAQFHYSTAPSAVTFSCANSARVSQSFNSASDTSLLVDSTEGLPPNGFVIFDQGDDVSQAAVKYNSKTPTSFEGCSLVVGSPSAVYSVGELITGVSQIASTITNDFEGEPFPSTIDLFDASAFPDSGAFCLNYGLSTRRVFLYFSKTDNTLQGVTHTSEGTEATFVADSLIVFVDRGFSSTEEDTVGGYLSTIISAGA